MERRARGGLILFGFSRRSPSFQCAPQHVLNNSSLYPISFALNVILCNGYITNPKEGITIYIYIHIFITQKCLIFVMVTSSIFFCYEWANQRLPIKKIK